METARLLLSVADAVMNNVAAFVACVGDRNVENEKGNAING